MLFKLSNLNSNLALTLGYLNPALKNSALVIIAIQPLNKWGNGSSQTRFRILIYRLCRSVHLFTNPYRIQRYLA